MTAGTTTSCDLYFGYYAKLANQMNMLQDSVRTNSYDDAIRSNSSNFADKIIMDVGAGSGILSFLAAQAGARLVLAVEASRAADLCRLLVASNPLIGSRVMVIQSRVEDMEAQDFLSMVEGPSCEAARSTRSSLYIPSKAAMIEFPQPRQIDTIISEPIGTFLFNERMVESFLFARDKFLKPGGKLFPSSARLYMAPFTDTTLYADTTQKAAFWNDRDFHGIDLSAAAAQALREAFEQPVLDYVDPTSLVAPANHHLFDFLSIPRHDLQQFTFPLNFSIEEATLIHGICGWFDIHFDGSDKTTGFRTAPWASPTHWHQIRFLLLKPLAVNGGQVVEGFLRMEAHEQQSYHVQIELRLAGTEIKAESARIDLKDPEYRWYSNSSSAFRESLSAAAAAADGCVTDVQAAAPV